MGAMDALQRLQPQWPSADRRRISAIVRLIRGMASPNTSNLASAPSGGEPGSARAAAAYLEAMVQDTSPDAARLLNTLAPQACWPPAQPHADEPMLQAGERPRDLRPQQLGPDGRDTWAGRGHDRQPACAVPRGGVQSACAPSMCIGNTFAADTIEGLLSEQSKWESDLQDVSLPNVPQSHFEGCPFNVLLSKYQRNELTQLAHHGEQRSEATVEC